MKNILSWLSRFRQQSRKKLDQHIIHHIQKNYGWDQAAALYFAKHYDKLALLQAKKVGSKIYTQLYLASQLLPRERLNLVLQHLEAEIDEHHFLQLRRKLSETLRPDSSFYAAFRRDVLQVYYVEKGDFNDSLGQKIHLLRYWFDRQNINYIRKNFKGSTDLDKLLAYSSAYQLKLDFTTGANFHNRTREAFEFPKNMKIQVPKHNTLRGLNNARMSEFIVDMTTGAFVSEWDVYRMAHNDYESNPKAYDLTEGGPIANTSSFNYGFSFGLNRDVPRKYRHSHQVLDVGHPRDNAVRRRMAGAWKTEKYVKQGGRYQDIVKRAGLKDLETWLNLAESERLEHFKSFSTSRYAKRGFHQHHKRQSKKKT